MKQLMTTILLLITIGIAQDITNKLGGDTVDETYDITDSNDNVLFQVRGDGDALIGTSASSAKLSVESSDSDAIYGNQTTSTGFNHGVHGNTNAATGAGVKGSAGPTGANFGGHFSSSAMDGTGVYGSGHQYGGFFSSTAFATGVGLYSEGSQFAGQFDGDVSVNGTVTVNNFLNLDNGSQTVSTDDTLTPTSSYMKLQPQVPTHISLSSTTAIADGSTVGQILFVENWGSTYNIVIPNNANTRLGSDRTLTPYQVLQLIWSGNEWVMPNN